MPELLCLSAIAVPVQANAAQEYIVTTGPAGIWVLNVNNTSYVNTVPGDPFIPTPLPGTVAEDEPIVFGLDATGEYLYADYNTCLSPLGVAISHLINSSASRWLMESHIRFRNFDGRLCAGCPALFNSIVVTAHYVFVMKNTWDAIAVIYVNTVAEHVAIYDITGLPSHPPRLIVTKPQLCGVLVGAQ